MFLMRADSLRGEVVGGLALEISSFVGPCEMARADRRVPLGADRQSSTSQSSESVKLFLQSFHVCIHCHSPVI